MAGLIDTWGGHIMKLSQFRFTVAMVIPMFCICLNYQIHPVSTARIHRQTLTHLLEHAGMAHRLKSSRPPFSPNLLDNKLWEYTL